MKKLMVLPLVLVFIFLFCGCADNKAVKPLLENITFTMQIVYENSIILCDAELEKSALKLTVFEPKTIKGFTLVIDKNGCNARFGDITYDFQKHNDLGNIIYNIIQEAKSKKDIKINAKNAIIKGKIDGCNYEFAFSPAGLPLSLKTENPKLKINFKNVTIKSEGG